MLTNAPPTSMVPGTGAPGQAAIAATIGATVAAISSVESSRPATPAPVISEMEFPSTSGSQPLSLGVDDGDGDGDGEEEVPALGVAEALGVGNGDGEGEGSQARSNAARWYTGFASSCPSVDQMLPPTMSVELGVVSRHSSASTDVLPCAALVRPPPSGSSSKVEASRMRATCGLLARPAVSHKPPSSRCPSRDTARARTSP